MRRIIAVLFCFAAVRVEGGRDVWTGGGPFGAPIAAIAVDPREPAVIYAGSGEAAALYPPYQSRLWKTVDGGAHWRSIASGLAGTGSAAQLGAGPIGAIAVEPSSSSIVYVGTGFGGVFRSSNGGDSWRAAMPACGQYGPPECEVHALAIDPSRPETVYAGTASGLYRTDDGAETWSSVSLAGFTNDYVTRIVFDPSDADTIFVGTGVDLLRSDDRGVTWAAVDGGHVAPGIRDVVVDPADPSNLYVVDADSQVFRLSNRGASWQALPAPSGVSTLTVDPAQPGVIYGARRPGTDLRIDDGVWRSDDGGEHWTPIGDSALDGGAATIVPAGMGEILIGTTTGVFESSGRGGTWTAANRGIADVAVSAIVVDPTLSGHVFSAGFTYGGSDWISETADGGGDWTMLPETLGSGASSIGPSVAVDPLDPATVYAVTGSRLLKSSDGGGSWGRTGLDVFGREVEFGLVAVDPRQEGIVYDVAPGGEVATSADGGSTWNIGVFPVHPTSALSPLILSALVVDPLTVGRLYVSGDFGVARSSDFGITWTLLSGLPAGGISALAASPFRAGTLFAGRDGVYRSTDGGDTWKKTGGATGEFSADAIVGDPAHEGTLYAGGYQGVFMSRDDGESWLALSSGFPPPAIVLSLAIDAGGTRLYAGTSQGVFEWTRVSVSTLAPPEARTISRR
ncbi:MAG TPA: hypothetical protein VKH46_09635 [Thermoanaerobaculia bacterium]|nr:hypothetical protein [Thermoanaerobaculia bacterium]